MQISKPFLTDILWNAFRLKLIFGKSRGELPQSKFNCGTGERDNYTVGNLRLIWCNKTIYNESGVADFRLIPRVIQTIPSKN